MVFRQEDLLIKFVIDSQVLQQVSLVNYLGCALIYQDETRIHFKESAQQFQEHDDGQIKCIRLWLRQHYCMIQIYG